MYFPLHNAGKSTFPLFPLLMRIQTPEEGGDSFFCFHNTILS